MSPICINAFDAYKALTVTRTARKLKRDAYTQFERRPGGTLSRPHSGYKNFRVIKVDDLL